MDRSEQPSAAPKPWTLHLTPNVTSGDDVGKHPHLYSMDLRIRTVFVLFLSSKRMNVLKGLVEVKMGADDV